MRTEVGTIMGLKLIGEREVRRRIKERAATAGGVRALAREMGMSPSLVSDTINGRRGPSEVFLGLLGLRRVEGFAEVAKGVNREE